MRQDSVRKFTLLGLTLMGAAAVTAAVMPKNSPKNFIGEIVPSTAGQTNELTCTNRGDADQCNVTITAQANGVGSRSTTGTIDMNNDGSSSITLASGGRVRSLTSDANGNLVQNRNTSDV